MNCEYAKMKSPVGNLHLFANKTHLIALIFEKNVDAAKEKYGSTPAQNNLVINETIRQLTEYFDLKRKDFDLPFELIGTDFQKSVWMALTQIPYGKTKSYQEQALLIRNPKATRAVGRTNGLNPISIIVPCHRVIGKSGKLTGYGGGLDVKEKLLALEQEAQT